MKDFVVVLTTEGKHVELNPAHIVRVDLKHTGNAQTFTLTNGGTVTGEVVTESIQPGE